MSDAQSTRTTGNHAPLMAPESRMPFYEGMAFGLSYPTLVCRLKVRPGDQLSLSTLDRGMRGFIDPSSLIEAPGESGSGSVKALMERLNYWQAALQKSYNIPVFGDCHVRVKEEAPDSAGVFGALCAMPYAQVDASRAALQWVVAALNYFHHHPDEAGGKPEALEQALTAIEPALRRAGLQGTNALHFFEAAHLLNIPATRLNADICAVGTGIHSRWLASSITDRTGFLGVTLARSKFASAAILAQFGLPVPRHVRVRNEEEAVKAAETLAWPVVVKPEDRDQGEGVYPALGSEERVRFAFRESRRVAENILVEKHHPGEDYRLTVLEGRVVKVMHRRPATAYGDGTKTVIQLAEDLQQERRHQEAYRRTGKKRIELDAEALGLLEEQGLTPDSVPDSGMAVRLRGKSNISSGGSHELVPLEAIHPDNQSGAGDPYRPIAESGSGGHRSDHSRYRCALAQQRRCAVRGQCPTPDRLPGHARTLPAYPASAGGPGSRDPAASDRHPGTARRGGFAHIAGTGAPARLQWRER